MTQRCYRGAVSFFGIGPMEMVVIAVVALMVFNPRELPKMLRSVAKFWGQLRATADEFKDMIEEVVDALADDRTLGRHDFQEQMIW